MSIQTPETDKVHQRLGVITALLGMAASRTWSYLDDRRTGPAGSHSGDLTGELSHGSVGHDVVALHMLGLGAYLARSGAAQLLPRVYTGVDLEDDGAITTLAGRLRAADVRTNVYPNHDVDYLDDRKGVGDVAQQDTAATGGRQATGVPAGVLELILSAEQLSRSLPVDLPGVTSLVVDLCDLAEEARGLDC